MYINLNSFKSVQFGEVILKKKKSTTGEVKQPHKNFYNSLLPYIVLFIHF